jgi:tetratricopeptide (TPR) repeat protein
VLKKIIFTLLILFASTDLRAQLSEPDSSRFRSMIFRIFSLDRIDPNDYEKGYIFDRIFKRREFHRPVNFIPLELRYGFGYNSGGGFLGLGNLRSSWMSYENEGVSSFSGGNFSSRLGHQLDIDILKTNLAYYWFGNSWLDMHSGINLRYSSLLIPSKIPSDWNGIKESWKLNAKFNARIFELGWSQSLILQWFESWFTSYRYTYGIALSQFYQKESSPYGFGPSQSITIGGRYIIDRDMANRFSIGLDFKFTSTSINKINDPKDVTPIKSFNIQTAGLYATASVFFGGQQTKGDLGKSYYYAKDYISAKRYLNEFIDDNPNHANINSALKLVVESDRKIPYQIMRQGMSFDERGMVVRAIEKYIRAKAIADTLLADVIDDRIREITYREIERAEKWLYAGQSDTAIAHVVMATGWYPELSHHINRFKVYNFMTKGEQLYKIGLYDRALKYFNAAQKINPSLDFEVATHKHRIASDLLITADTLRDINSLKFVVFALEETQRLTGSLSPANMKTLDLLKKKMHLREEYEIRKKIDSRLKKEKRDKSKNKPIYIGMTVSEVDKIMGKPHEIITNDSSGKNQLWIYKYQNEKGVALTFIDYKLIKIEE